MKLSDYTIFSDRLDNLTNAKLLQVDINSPDFELSEGHYSYVLGRDEDSVYKIIKPLVKAEGGKAEFTPNLKPLLKSDTSKHLLTESFLEIAKSRDNAYQMFIKYLPENSVIQLQTEYCYVPIKLIVMSMNPESELLEMTPEYCFTIVEIWEKVRRENILQKMEYQKLKSLYSTDLFREQLSLFAERAMRLFVEEGVMIDLVDLSGIKIHTDSSVESITEVTDLFQTFANSNKSELIITPRSVAWQDKQLKVFDTFPVFSIPAGLEISDPEAFYNTIISNDSEFILEWLNNGFTIDFIYYLILLGYFKAFGR